MTAPGFGEGLAPIGELSPTTPTTTMASEIPRRRRPRVGAINGRWEKSSTFGRQGGSGMGAKPGHPG